MVVDVYRSLGPKRAEPLTGSTCFFQERLAAWRELNAAHDWLEAATELHSLCQSLPQLLHHQDEILDIILSRINMEASLSLEPLLELLGALARDLQADFLPHMDRVLTVLSDFVDSGGDREPELLQHVFTCCSLLCKHLCKLLASDVTQVLSQSARLRYHRAYHVRSLAAESFGFLLRHAHSTAARAAVRAVLADAVIRPSIARVNGAGLLIAEAVSGVSNGLHSRGTTLLQLLLQEDILSQKDFVNTNGSAHGVNAIDDDNHSPLALSSAVVGTKRKSNELKKKTSSCTTLSRETISARIAAVAAQCLDRLLNHVRRGPAVQPLWEVVRRKVMSRVETILEISDNEEDQEEEEDAYKRYSAARSIALLARMLEYHRGSRVEAYAPLFKVATKLVNEKVLPSESEDSKDWNSGFSGSEKKHTTKNTRSKKGGDGEEEIEEEEAFQKTAAAQRQESAYSEFLRPSLSKQILRYLQSLVYAHCKIVSASEGPVAIHRVAPLWAGIFARAPQFEILHFIRALITPPAGAETSRCFAPHMLAAVGRNLLSGDFTEVCWPLLMDLCDVLGGARDTVFLPSNSGNGAGVVPLILTAGSGIGHKLSKLICTTVSSFKYIEKEKKKDRERAIQETWAALHCLPHAVANSSQAAEHITTLLASTATALTKAISSSSNTEDEFENILMLHCAARAAAAATTGSSQPGNKEEQQVFVEDALKLVEAYPHHYHAVHTAAETLERAATTTSKNTSINELSSKAMVLAENLAHPSAPLRVATLRVLCSFRQPDSLPSSDEKATEAAGGKAATTLPVCDVLPQLLSVHSRELGADGGRPAIVSLGRVKTHLEFHHVPETLVPLVVRSLLGVLHIRFAPLWPASGAALSMALDVYPSLAWPIIFEHLSSAQTAFLGGDYYTPRSREEERTPPYFSANNTNTNNNNNNNTEKSFEIGEVVLEARFALARVQGSSESNGGSADAAAQLTHILRAMTTSNNNILEGKSKEWVALFLSFSTAKSPDGVGLHEEADEEADDEDEKGNASGVAAMELGSDINTTTSHQQEHQQQQLSVVSPRAWRGALKEWLAMLSSLKGIRGIYKAAYIQRAVASHCLDVDPAVQQAALKCLKAFKLQWLAPYLDRLLRLADNKTLRSELAAFPLGKKPTSVREGDDIEAILPEHRAALVPLLVALLFPKMRKRSGRLGGKGEIIMFLGLKLSSLPLCVSLFLYNRD